MTGPAIDPAALERALNTAEGQQLPEAVKARIRATIDANRPSMGQRIMGGLHSIDQQISDQSKGIGEEMRVGLVETPWQFAHDFTAGIIPAPSMKGRSPQMQQEWNSTIKPLVGISAIVGQVWSATEILNFASKAPAIGRVIEALPARMKAIGAGAIIGGATEAARPPDFIPEQGQASGWDPPAWMGQKLTDLTGLGPRAGLAVGGTLFGGAAGEILGGIMTGLQKARTAAVATTMDEQTILAMRDALRNSGIEIGEGEGRYKIADKFVRNMRKVAMNEKMAAVMSEQLSREDYILSEMFGSANSAQATGPTTVSEEGGRLIAGIFRTNPGGMTVVTGMKDPDLVSTAARKLGLKLDFEIIERPPVPGRKDINPNPPTGKMVNVFGGKVSVDEGFLNGPVDHRLVDDLVNAGVDPNTPYYRATGTLPDYFVGEISNHWGNPNSTNRDVINVLEEYLTRNPKDKGNKEIANIIKRYSASEFRDMSGMPEWSEWHADPNAQDYLTKDATRFLVTKNTRSAAGGLEGPWRVTYVEDNPHTGSPIPLGHSSFKTQGEAEKFVEERGGQLTDRSIASRQPKYDLIVSKPVYEYPAASELGKLNAKVTQQLKALSAETANSVRAPKTTEAFILSDGTPIRGGLSTTDLERKLRLQAPIVAGTPRQDLALRSAAQPIRMDLVGDRELVVELPHKLTQEQFNAIGRSLDAVKMDKVTLKLGTEERVLTSPLGAQAQDAISELVKPKSIRSAITPGIKAQFERTGVFQGQAAVLPDGTPAEVLSQAGGRTGNRLMRVRDSMTGTIHTIGEKQLTLLPTSLTSELQPSQLFTNLLSQSEREALAKMRFAVQQGWGKEITKARDLKSFGNSRGFLVTALRGGKFELSKVNDGGADPIVASSLKAAVEFIRHDQSAMPDLTPQGIVNLLGENLNIGWIGGGGHPPLPNEMIPIDWDHFQRSLDALPTGRGISMMDAMIRPTKALMEQIDRKYDLQFSKIFENVASSMVAKQNFESLWFHGRGGQLPNGVKPLDRIFKAAGRGADWERITDWRESVKSTPEEQAIWNSLTKSEQTAATELGQWFDAAYTHFGVEAPFVENYMPHFREMAEKGNGTDLKALWQLQGGDPLKPPKGLDWVNEMIREGNMDIYEKDARNIAVMYLRGAGHTRFMKDAYNQAREVVLAVSSKNNHLGSVMGHFLQAVRGTEFPEQRAILGETLTRVLEKLPGNKVEQSARSADRMVDLLTGAVYSSTMGFRPSLALRNASSALVMVWPVYGGNSRFLEAMGRAMTVAGKDEAAAARAISHSQGARFAQTEIDAAMRETLPQWLQEMNETGMNLYDSADQFTRATAYHAAKMRAEDAILAFSKKVGPTTSASAIEAAKKELITESRMFIQDKQVVDEFLRRVGTNPEDAARFAGKQASDVVNFLYGRGMQAQWMRSVGGRLFGQFGTWSMWYIDYLRRLVGRAGMAGYRSEALKLLARHAIVNAAIFAAGKEVLDVDLSKWASYGAVFWSGGPGIQVLAGASSLMRGLGSVTSGNEDPLARSRITEGASMIWQTMPTYVPFWFGGRDAIRIVESNNPTEFLAAALGTTPTRKFTMEDRMNRILGINGEPFTSSSPALEDVLNARAMGRPTLDIRGIGAGAAPVTPQGQPAGGSSQSSSASVSMPANTPPNVQANLQNEVKKPAESQPIRNF